MVCADQETAYPGPEPLPNLPPNAKPDSDVITAVYPEIVFVTWNAINQEVSRRGHIDIQSIDPANELSSPWPSKTNTPNHPGSGAGQI